MDLFNNIKKLSNVKGLSIAQLEKELGFSNGSIARWKKSSPSLEKVEKVASFFSVSIDYLVGKSNIKNYENLKELLILTHNIVDDDLTEDEKIDLMTFIQEHSQQDN